MKTVLYISVVTLLFAFCMFALVACWGIFEDTEVGQMVIDRIKKKHGEREEE